MIILFKAFIQRELKEEKPFVYAIRAGFSLRLCNFAPLRLIFFKFDVIGKGH